MKRVNWSRLVKMSGAIALVVAAAVAAGQVCNAQMVRREKRETARRDQLEVARMTQQMRTICIGRFLIDLPEEANVELREMSIDGFQIVSFDEQAADFQARLLQRETRLRTAPDRLERRKSLESVRDVKTANGVVGKIFVHSWTVSEGTRARGLEQERYRYERIAVEALVHADGMSYEIGSDGYDTDRVDDLPKLIAKLVPNRGNRAPQEPGFCVYNAWFRDPLAADQNERLKMRAELPRHPDIDLRLDLMAGASPQGPGLLARSAEAYKWRSYAEKKRISRLRAAPRTIDGLTGDEVVDEVEALNNVFVQDFRWEVDGTADKVFIPRLTVTMKTGGAVNGPVPSSLSQEAAIALWDKIKSSIRFHTPPTAHRTRPTSHVVEYCVGCAVAPARDLTVPLPA